MSTADLVRNTFEQRRVGPAPLLGLNGGQAAAVCQALENETFLASSGLRLVERKGPPSMRSTTVQYRFSFIQNANGDGEKTLDQFLELHGIFKDSFEVLGGAERFIKFQRESSTGYSTPC